MLVISLLAACLAALPAAPAAAAPSSVPTIKLVSPMRVGVGRTITVKGAGFSSNRRRNTVIFVSPAKRTAFAKPRRASGRRLVVRIPGSVERLLSNPDSKGVGGPTRFRLRVVVGRRYGKMSLRRNSPVVLSSLRSGAPATCGEGSDFDRDLVSNSLEARYGTDPCSADTDKDGVEDGFEQESALDLNQRAVPYPGKRPFPNALDATDAQHDYDGDGLSNLSEFQAWAKATATPPPSGLQAYSGSLQAPAFGGPYGDRPRFGNHEMPMNYSDGKQASISVTTGSTEYKSYLDFDGSGSLTDDERDADGDGLRNIDERHPGMNPDYFLLMQENHYVNGDDCDFKYDPILPRPFLEPDYLDWDSDGDGVWDGNDDQDSDGVANVDEIKPPHGICGEEPDNIKISPLPYGNIRDGSLRVRNPYNPCLPYRSDFCNRYSPRE